MSESFREADFRVIERRTFQICGLSIPINSPPGEGREDSLCLGKTHHSVEQVVGVITLSVSWVVLLILSYNLMVRLNHVMVLKPPH